MSEHGALEGPDPRVAQLLTLESFRDEWEAKTPPWRLIGAAVVALTLGSVAAEFLMGVLAGFVVLALLTAPVTLFVRKLRLAEIDRQISELKRESAGELPDSTDGSQAMIDSRQGT